MSKVRQLILYIIFFSLLLLTCDEEKKNPIKFSVKSTNGNFTGGWYKLNGDSTNTFIGASMDNDIYEYELELDDVDYLEVGVCKNTVDQSVEIKIYRDGVKVKSDLVEPNEESGTSYTYCLELDYEYGEEESSDTTTDTSS